MGLKSRRFDCKGHSERKDNGGMAEREEQADRHGLLFFLHEFAGHVVDGSNVIDVESMPQTEAEASTAVPKRIGKSFNATSAQPHAAILAAKRRV